MPMQVFEFQADSSVTLETTAAINRKSCDHCFLNRKTCNKVRTLDDSGDKCMRCAKDKRPCTFTPTVHLYHIADCVGRHQCRAKVIQAMGGRKKEVKFKTIEIPIVCDMDSDLDQALYEYIQKQPNLLVYNNRIKSFLAQDMLGLSEDQESSLSTQDDRGVPDSSAPSDSPIHRSKRSFDAEDTPNISESFTANTATSPAQGPHKYRILALIDAHQNQNQNQQSQQQQQQPQHSHPRRLSDDQGRQGLNSAPSPIMSPLDMMQMGDALSPIDAMNYQQRRQADSLTATGLLSFSTANQLGSIFQMQQPTVVSNHQLAHHDQHSQGFHHPQPLPRLQTGYRSTSPLPPSPLDHSPTRYSPQPPSPLELSLSINTNFGALNNTNQNLPSLFDSSLTMSTQQHAQQQQQQQQQVQQVQQQPTRTSVGTSTSPQMGSANLTDNTMEAPPPPLVITTTNEDGNEVGFYYAVPSVNLNPAYNDADLFQDFTMMDALGEDFVWIENLFDEPTAEEAAANMVAMSVAAATGQQSVTTGTGSLEDNSGAGNVALSINTMMASGNNDLSMGDSTPTTSQTQDGLLQQPMQQAWMSQDYSQSI
ncbi:hypothetical protein BGZ51_005440 [Haplosporangium sp. Z 767]|nr:hypothetical protein BGZ51_005440 [Haplosporangium sp. Z 767]